jgi:methyltransferase
VILPPLALMLGFVAGQRVGELWISRKNTRALLAAGGVEHGAGHYPLFIVLHVGWIAAMAWFIPFYTQPNLFLLALFLVFQLGRVWVIFSLGPYWTTRIITLPGEPLVKSGPYRYVRHPNYLVVAAEIILLPLAFGAWRIALIFAFLNGLLTLYRIRVEEAALAERR